MAGRISLKSSIIALMVVGTIGSVLHSCSKKGPMEVENGRIVDESSMVEEPKAVDEEPIEEEPVSIFDLFDEEIVVGPDQLPTKLTRIRFFPNSEEFLVTGKTGWVFHFRLETESPKYLGAFKIPDVAPSPSDLGLTEVLFDPEFSANRRVYFCFTTGDGRWNRVVQLQWNGNYETASNSLSIVLNVSRKQPVKNWHGIYSMAFGEDGYLYTAMGDATQDSLSQDPSTLLGKLIRIIPEEGGGYSIPPDNPFVGPDGIKDEIIAFGIRSPFRTVAWREFIIFGDVGSSRYEELNIYSRGITNFGWPECEGICGHPEYQDPAISIGQEDLTFILEDPEATGEVRVSIGIGVVYDWGDEDPYRDLLDEMLLFYDVFLGYVRAVPISISGELGESEHIFHLDTVTSMDMGPDGFIYGTTLVESQVFRVILKQEDDVNRP